MQIVNFIIPAVCVALCWLVLAGAGVPRRLVPPLALAGGQGLWFAAIVLFVFAIGGNGLSVLLDTCVDLVAIPILVGMLAWRPARGWLYALIVYEVVSIGLSLALLAGLTGPLVIPLLVHIALRTAVIVTAVLALRRFDEIGPRNASAAGRGGSGTGR